MPEWYLLIRAARYLGVAPWELMEQPQVWLQWALACEGAENHATEQARKQRGYR